MSKLIIKNLYKRYENKGKKKTQPNDFAVNDLSLECEDGEFIGYWVRRAAARQLHSA